MKKKHRKIIKPKKLTKPYKKKAKEKINSNIDMNDEIKLLRETLKGVIDDLNLEGYDEFLIYYNKVENIKQNSKNNIQSV